MSKPEKLTEAQLQEFLAANAGWKIENGMLVQTFEARTFLEGIDFVQKIARLAEAADHHPDIDIRWRKVTLKFVTHDAGNAITDLDARLAKECSLLFSAL
ncbi:MAG: 4a-hydroxytetrahydrobiopterin dehydratase [Archangium sp.]